MTLHNKWFEEAAPISSAAWASVMREEHRARQFKIPRCPACGCNQLIDGCFCGIELEGDHRMVTLNDWLISCARECDHAGWSYPILANHFDFSAAGAKGMTVSAAVEAAKDAWHRWMKDADKR